jgi:hypothetical protein
VQPKATKEKKEESTPTNRLPIDASKLDNDEMALIIQSFWQILKQRKGRTTNLAPRGFATDVVSPVTILLNVHIQVIVTGRRQEREEEDGEEKKYYNKKKGGEVHMGQEWDSDESSIDSSSEEDATNIAINKGLLFPNIGHKCLMAKDSKKKKVHSRDTPKYTTSDGEGRSSEKDDDLYSLFANLTIEQKGKINELIKPLTRRMKSWNAKKTCSLRKIKKMLS